MAERLSRMKQFATLLCALLISACGGGGGGFPDPTITGIQIGSLRYGNSVMVQIFGNNLASPTNGIIPTISNCTTPTPYAKILGEEDFTCTVTATGDLQVQVKNVSGTVIYNKTFTVPAPQVTLDTSMGTMVVELNPTAAPKTVNNFLGYVSRGFYSNTLFHRVIAGFVVQGGGYTSGMVTKPGALAAIALETPNGLSNLRGTIAMARTTVPNSATSQFYFNVVDNLSLDYKDAANPGYAVFGKIVTGAGVMDAIAAVHTHTFNTVTDVPIIDVVVNSATQTQ